MWLERFVLQSMIQMQAILMPWKTELAIGLLSGRFFVMMRSPTSYRAWRSIKLLSWSESSASMFLRLSPSWWISFGCLWAREKHFAAPECQFHPLPCAFDIGCPLCLDSASILLSDSGWWRDSNFREEGQASQLSWEFRHPGVQESIDEWEWAFCHWFSSGW